MKGETRETKWAVLLSHEKELSKGNNIMIKDVEPYALHGGSYLETGSSKFVTISDVKKIAPNMLLVETDDADYYMYCYNLSDKKLRVSAEECGRLLSGYPKIGKKLRFERESTVNSVFKIDAIYKGLQIAWCKDESEEDIGYIIDIDKTGDSIIGNYHWLWSTSVITAGRECDAKITVDLAGKHITKHICFVPKSATPIGENTLIEGEDGNYYIRMFPMDRCWRE